jgi:hypothetical protein
VRRNFLHYQSILSSFNCLLTPLFGQHPDQWSYTDLAAPLFLNEAGVEPKPDEG